jgi:ribonuclease HI
MILNIYTDGASRSNPGKSASGYIIFGENGELLLKKSFYNGIKTNNEAEYLAIVAALAAIEHEYGYNVRINLFSDSKLAINQLKGDFKIKSHSLKELHKEASTLLKKFESHSLINVPRENEHISEVDAALNRLLDKYE